MKLPNFALDENLIQLRDAMNAPYISWDSQARWVSFDPDDLLSRLEIGIELESLEEVIPARDGTLEYRGQKVVVYIKDQIGQQSRFFNAGNASNYKFHLADCQTLKSMKTAGRYERYVVSNRTDGKFPVNFEAGGRIVDENVECELGVCINCLRRINYQEYRRKSSVEQRRIKGGFSLEVFFKSYRSSISQIPRHTEESAPKNEYSEDWNRRSLEYRQKKGWCCEKCGALLSPASSRKYLQVHHINGLKNENQESNIIALCIGCHADEPMHGHLKAHPDYKEYVEMRRRQGHSLY